MKKILAFILTISMLCAMSACGAGTSSAPASSQPEATTAPAEETQSAPEAPSQEPTEAPSAEEPASAEDVTPEPANQIEYPLEESYTFTMTATLRNNVLQVLGDDDFSVTSAYRGLEAATGCSIDFNMLGEATAEEKTNIMLASGDMTDFYTGLGSYGNNLTGAIHDGILFDMAPMLEEYAPDYKALLDSDAELAASATNPDGTISMFVSQAADVVEKGILIRQD